MWRYIHARTIVRVAARLKRVPPDRSQQLHAYIRRLIEGLPAFSILQVGAYDGVSNDPVHELLRDYSHVRAVLLEPQPHPYAALQKLWAGSPRITPIRAALSDCAGERSFYVIADAYRHLHPFPDQVSSFHRSRVEVAYSRYVWRPAGEFISSMKVPTVDWQTLVERYGRFEMVAVDAEGYDAEVVNQIDLERTPPSVILYEHSLLPRNTRRRSQRRLEVHGYRVAQVNNIDTVATRAGLPSFK
jgi:FkbM family methyltransferase